MYNGWVVPVVIILVIACSLGYMATNYVVTENGGWAKLFGGAILPDEADPMLNTVNQLNDTVRTQNETIGKQADAIGGLSNTVSQQSNTITELVDENIKLTSEQRDYYEAQLEQAKMDKYLTLGFVAIIVIVLAVVALKKPAKASTP